MERGDAAKALHAAAEAAQEAADAVSLERVARKIVALCEASGDRRELAWGYYFLGSSHFQRNDGAQAEKAYRKGLALFTDLSDRAGIARLMMALGAVAADIDLDVVKARRLYDEALPMVRQSGDRRRLAVALGNLAEICRLEGDHTPAMRHAKESMTLFADLGDPAHAGWQCANLAHLHALRREYPIALECMRRSYEYLKEDPNSRWMAWYFDIWFMLAAALERWEIAATLLGFANHFRDTNNTRRLPGILPWFSTPMERVAKRLGTDRLHELQLQGELLTLDEARALAESISTEPSSGSAGEGVSLGRTRRQ